MTQHDKDHTSHHIARSIANGFGALGYMSLLLQWAWALLLFSYPYMESGSLMRLLFSERTAKPIAQTSSVPLTPAIISLSVVITVIVLIMMVIVIIRFPSAVEKQGVHVTQKAAASIIPIITHHQEIPKKHRTKLTYQIIIVIKGFAIIIPLAYTLLWVPNTLALSGEIIRIITYFTASCTFMWFGFQYSLAAIRHISFSDIR